LRAGNATGRTVRCRLRTIVGGAAMKATKADAALEACVAALGAFIEHDNAQSRKALAEARQRFRYDASAELGVPVAQQPAATPAGAA
jgi:hypothetical protein